MDDDTYTVSRDEMVSLQIERRGVSNQRVLTAMRQVPRHLFVPPELRPQSYADRPLPIGFEQTISQPYIVGLMSALLNLHEDETVLEIGTGSGYQAAVLSLLVKKVHSSEIIPQLASQAEYVLYRQGYKNVEVHLSDGSCGWAEAAPYDAILVTASAPRVPPPLLYQLSPKGRLVIPVGERSSQSLELWTRENDVWQPQTILPVAFVPLRGKHGWQDEK